MSKGRVYILSGPSGTGKDTVLKNVFEKCPQVAFSISSTTRPIREGEVEGEKYNFITRERFLEMIKDDELLEHNEFVDNYYGTPKAPVVDCISRGVDIIIEVDVNGAAQIREKMPDAVSVFIMPPSLEELKRRLRGRGTDSEEVIQKRLDEALSEIERAPEYDYIVVNDILDTAVSDFIEVMSIDRLRTDRNLNLINKILGK